VADLRIVDDEGRSVGLDAAEAAALFAVTDGLDQATTSACPDCRSRVVSVVALVDLLDRVAPHPRGGEIVELADDAPTLHLYVVDGSTRCSHRRWRDPGHEEWGDAVAPSHPTRRRP
jgi:hypothetical protein